MRAVRTFAVLGLLVVPSATFSQQPADIVVEDDAVYLVSTVGSVSTYEYVVTYEIYFKGDALPGTLVRTSDDDDGNPLFKQIDVDRVAGMDESAAPRLEACIDDVCRPLAIDPPQIGGLEDQPAFAMIVTDAAGLKEGADVRFHAPAGWLQLADAGGAVRDSPALSLVFPRVGKREKSVLQSKPVFEIALSPLTEDQEGDASNGASIFFDGGVHRFRPSHKLGLTYAGAVATEDRLGFDRIKADFEYERNLLRGDYLPLMLTAGAETDQDLDVVNAVAGAGLQFLLPFNVNYSPADDYIPNTGPLIRVRAEAGRRVAEPDPGESTDAVLDNAPEEFERAGYSIQWKIPVARKTVLRLHHAGQWVFSDDLDNEFHKLWDVALETEIGNLTYFVGFQEGEAAPLFQPIETTQVGILIRFGRQFACRKNPDTGNDWSCAKTSR